MAKKSYWPAPVYIATMADGSRERISFWSQEGKELDFDRGRRLLESFTGQRVVDGAAEFESNLHADPAFYPDELKMVPLRARANWHAIAEAARKALERGQPAEALAVLQHAA